MCAPQVSDRPDPNYDVPTLLGLADGTSGTEFCLLGGRTDLFGLRADVCDWSRPEGRSVGLLWGYCSVQAYPPDAPCAPMCSL